MERTFVYDFDRDEALRVSLDLLRRLPSERRGKWILGVIVPLVAALFWWWSSTWEWHYVSFDVGSFIFPFAVLWFPLFTFVGMPIIIRRQTRKYLDQNPGLRGNLTVKLADDVLESIGGDGSMARYPWMSIRGGFENEEALVLQPAPRFGVYIPKRVIPPDDLPPLRAWLREKVPAFS